MNIIYKMIPLFNRVGSSFFQGVILVILAQTTSKENFGAYSTVCAFGAICIGVVGLGLPTQSLQIKKYNNKNIASVYVSLAFVLAIISFLSTYILSTLIFSCSIEILLSSSLYIASELYINILQSTLYGMGRNKKAEVVLFLRRFLPLAFVSVSFFYKELDIFLLFSFAYFILILFGVIFVRELFVKCERDLFFTVITDSKHYWLSNIWSMMQQFDLILMNKFFGATQVAVYSAGFRLASPVHLVTSILISRFLPELSSVRSKTIKFEIEKNYLRYGVFYSIFLILASPMSMIIFPFVLGHSYSSDLYIFPILICSSAINVINQLISAFLYSFDFDGEIQRLNRNTTIVGLLIVMSGCVSHNFVLSSSGIFLSQIFLFLFLLKLRAKINKEVAR